MPQVQKTITITIDDTIFEVANMSADVQSAVLYLDEWRQEEADLTSKLLMARAAINDVQNTLLKTIEAEQRKAGPVPTEVTPEPAKPKRARKESK